MSFEDVALVMQAQHSLSSAPLLTRTALVPAARASLPPRPRASSTLCICQAARTGTLTALCVQCAGPGNLPALAHHVHMHRAGEGAQNLL